MTESAPAQIETRRGRAVRGIELPAHKTASTQQPLAAAPLPSEVILPLEAGLSARDLRPAVETGQRVLRGQPLVQGGGPLSTWTHASTSGVVRSLERRRIAHPRRREALCAVIDVDGRDEPYAELARPDPTQWDTPEKLSAALSRAGIEGLGGAVFPTGLKLAAAERRRMRLVIINGMECEPYISCDDMLMRTSPRDVLAGALVLVELAGVNHGVVAIEEDKPEALKALERELPALDTQQRLSIVTVATMYPPAASASSSRRSRERRCLRSRSRRTSVTSARTSGPWPRSFAISSAASPSRAASRRSRAARSRRRAISRCVSARASRTWSRRAEGTVARSRG